MHRIDTRAEALAVARAAAIDLAAESLPKRLRIRGQMWRVVRKRLAHDEGVCDYQRRQILLDSRLEGEGLLDTFLHEVMHACFFEVSAWSPRTEERLIRRLAPRLLAVLVDIGWVPK